MTSSTPNLPPSVKYLSHRLDWLDITVDVALAITLATLALTALFSRLSDETALHWSLNALCVVGPLLLIALLVAHYFRRSFANSSDSRSLPATYSET